LQAIGPKPELLAAALNALIEQYKEDEGLVRRGRQRGLTAREEAASLSKAAIGGGLAWMRSGPRTACSRPSGMRTMRWPG
jgi:hypothetical protein